GALSQHVERAVGTERERTGVQQLRLARSAQRADVLSPGREDLDPMPGRVRDVDLPLTADRDTYGLREQSGTNVLAELSRKIALQHLALVGARNEERPVPDRHLGRSALSRDTLKARARRAEVNWQRMNSDEMPLGVVDVE